MAEDIRRYLAGHPVMARKDTLGYRAGKFVRRHKVGVVAAFLLVLSILGGTIATAWQVRRVAEQVFRAERRFMHFRKLANSFLFEFDDRIQKLRDLSEARQLVLDTGIEYIDGLAREAGGDPMLVRELARAYEKFGDVQGFRHEAPMGRAADALVSYRKAVRLVEPLSQERKADAEALLLLSRSYCSAGTMIEHVTGNLADAKDNYRRCLDTAWQATAGRMREMRFVALLHRAYHLLGDAELASGNHAAARECYLSILRILEKQNTALGVTGAVWLAETKRRIGLWEASRGDDDAALQSFEQALTLIRQPLAAKRTYTAMRETLFVYQDFLRHLLRLSRKGRFPQDPSPVVHEMMAVARGIATSYPRHPLTQGDLDASRALDSEVRGMINGRPDQASTTSGRPK
jgi:tetratricopeptide (TPR) repeat protein